MNLKVKLKSKYKLDTSNISRCILPISVGQQYHEALKFFVTLKEIEKHFNHCVIIVCDTLQRHTMKFLEGLSCENAYNLAKFQGEQWLDRNKIHIKNLRLSVDLVHWDIVCQEARFFESKEKIINLYQSDESFRNLYLNTAKSYVERKKYELKLPVDLAEKSCIEYLIEESTARLSWCSEKLQMHVYPSPDNLCLQEIHKRFKLNNLLPVTLKFKKIRVIEDVC